MAYGREDRACPIRMKNEEAGMIISKSDSYAQAGVDVTAGYESVKKIIPHIKSTFRPGVLGNFGGFGGMFEPDTSGRSYFFDIFLVSRQFQKSHFIPM